MSTFLMTSVFIFIVGFVCGHCFSQRRGKRISETIVQGEHSCPICDPNLTYEAVLPKVVKQEEQDLELKENVAYLTLPSTTTV